MGRNTDRSLQLIQKSIFGYIIIIILVSIYLSPILLNLNRYPSLYPKNIPSWYANYYNVTFFKESIMRFHQYPLWVCYFNGGYNYVESPVFQPVDPITLFLSQMFDENIAIKINWYLFFIFGACSMYYLTRFVLKYSSLGSIFSSLVFSMSGAFAYLFENGFYYARETLLIPLLLAFFIKSKDNKTYLILSSLVLSLMLLFTALFFPVILLFLFLFSLIYSIEYKDKRISLNTTYIYNFILIFLLTLLLCSFKVLPLLSSLLVNNRISGIEYNNAILQANTLDLFIKRIMMPYQSGAGTMYLGYIPVIASMLALVFFFREVKRIFLILLIFIMLSFGPNAKLDLHKVLWHLPIFNSISEIAKYYSVIVVFLIAILGGKFFLFFQKKQGNILIGSFAFLIIIITFLDLLNSNIGYFNIFDTKLRFESSKNDFFHIKGLNIHKGDETISTPLIYFLTKNNKGFIDNRFKFTRKTTVIPRYFLMPKYVFLAPSTKLLILPNPTYKGEAFFLNTHNKINTIDIVPNTISVDIDMHIPQDTLVINQNFDKNWRSPGEILENYNGLLSIRFNSTRKGILRLYFFPKLFFIGLFISVISFLLSLGFLLKGIFRRLTFR